MSNWKPINLIIEDKKITKNTLLLLQYKHDKSIHLEQAKANFTHQGKGIFNPHILLDECIYYAIVIPPLDLGDEYV